MSMVVDWRGVPDLSKRADLYSVASTHEKRPEVGKAGARVLVGVSPTILYGPAGVSTRKYNLALFSKMSSLGAVLPITVWNGGNGYSTRLFDLTKRGVLSAWLHLLAEHFPWADGFHVDYFTAMSWLDPSLAEKDERWDSSLTALANALRAKGFLVLGQQFHLTSPLLACNGAFVEQSPYAWRYTLDLHAADMKRWRELTARYDNQEMLWVYEVREWQTWPQASLDLVRQWAKEQGVHLALGRDANAVGD